MTPAQEVLADYRTTGLSLLAHPLQFLRKGACIVEDRYFDISGWRVSGGIDFVFKPGTIMPSNSVIYLSPDVNAFRARDGFYLAHGPFQKQTRLGAGHYRTGRRASHARDTAERRDK